MEITHFSHRHSLALSDQINNEARCSGCRLPISGGPAYVCASCNFFVHKSCGELPPQIDHPFHPFHPLTLGRAPHRSGKFYCKACRDLCSGFVFRCSQCDFNLDIVCASLMPSIHIEENQEQEIEHFSHPQHPLIPVTCCDDRHKIKCSVCDQAIKGLIYVCFRCQFFVHKSCFELPLQIRHPFHPHRDLTLLAKGPGDRFFSGSICHGCFNLSCGSVYHCPECDFNLDIGCSRLKPTTTQLKGNQEEEEQQIKHFSHEHHLTQVVPGVEEDTYNFACSVCSMDVKNSDGSIYACFDCKYFIHKSCADHLPMEIRDHPFHPQHSLTFGVAPQVSKDSCIVCEGSIEGLAFSCTSSCKFSLDVTCAIMLMPTTGNNDFDRPIQHHSHPHSLIQFDAKKALVLTCYGCEAILRSSSYVCPQCSFFLCRSCAELPEEIAHSFHPQHRITFLPDSHNNKKYFCTVCRRRDPGFVYHCAPCQFYMGLKCAKLSTVSYERHEHPLAFIKKYSDCRYIAESPVECHRCSSSCGSPYFSSFLRCALCDLNLHLQCIPPLPRKVKYGTHKHWLTLTDPLPEDGRYKYYCDACEGERNPKHSFYSCAECEFVAEIECGLKSEEFNSLQEESSVVRQLLDAGLDVFDYRFRNEKKEMDGGSDATRGGTEEEEETDNEKKEMDGGSDATRGGTEEEKETDNEKKEMDGGIDATRGGTEEEEETDNEKKEMEGGSDATRGGTEEDEETDSENDSVDSKLDGQIEYITRELKGFLQQNARHEEKRRALSQAGFIRGVDNR